jgi:purine-nucleoside phosphorylase
MSPHEAKQTALDEFTRAELAVNAIHHQQFAQKSHIAEPTVAVVLGSGLGAFADELKDAVVIHYADIPHFPHSTAIGHAGRLVIGTLGGLTVAAMQGRVHQYEGYSAREAAFPVRVLARLGVKSLVLTNAAGGINTAYAQGALVMLSDHINLQGSNPLLGPNDDRFGTRFPGMSHAYSVRYRELAQQAARELGIDLKQGVYAALSGPSYETPAEIRYLRTIGADLVGMSTVPEVIVARHMGLEVLAISCVTNMAAGLSSGEINHQEVLETGERVRGTFLALLTAILPGIAAEKN